MANEFHTHSTRAAAVMLTCLLLAACAGEPVPRTAARPGAPEPFPKNEYLRSSHRERVYQVDPAASRVLVYVYRGGPLAKLGHDHVVASHDVRGYALLPESLAKARADIYFPVSTLTVDEAALRRTAGFTTQLSDEDIANTRRRMLGMVLDAKEHPFIRIHATTTPAGTQDIILKAVVTLHGTTHTLAIPARLTSDRKTFSVHGEADIRQSDFGISPFSIFAGALVVEDQLHVIFSITGTRVESRG